MECAPILLFVYKRLDTLKLCIESLKKNVLHTESRLFIFSDAAACEEDDEKVSAVRLYINEISGFKSISINKAEKNKGLALSIISGVDQIVTVYRSVIVLEDDLVVSNNFLIYMNEALRYYQQKKTIFSISGFTTPVKVNNKFKNDVYFTQRASSWGWATWNDRWVDIDWEVSDFKNFIANAKLKKEFNRMGSDMLSMLKRQMRGQINSWAIRWCFHQFKNNLYTVFPVNSKVRNIGFNKQGTHTIQWYNRFTTEIDRSGKIHFNFSDQVKMDPDILKQFLSKHSIKARILSKILNMLPFHKLDSYGKYINR